MDLFPLFELKLNQQDLERLCIKLWGVWKDREIEFRLPTIKRFKPRALSVEINAIYLGTSFWIKKSPGTVRIFSDSIDVIHAINSDNTYKGVEEHVINEV